MTNQSKSVPPQEPPQKEDTTKIVKEEKKSKSMKNLIATSLKERVTQKV